MNILRAARSVGLSNTLQPLSLAFRIWNGHQVRHHQTRKIDPILLTPGPLTTSMSVKQAMMRDLGSRDTEFIDINRRVLQTLPKLINAEETHVAIPMQGSGTFAVEAMIGSLLPKFGKMMTLVNGAYGDRIKQICNRIGRDQIPYITDEDTVVNVEGMERLLKADKSITHVSVVYCETTTGIINPIRMISDIVKKYNRKLLIDAMSAFGALPFDAKEIEFEAVAASSNKCLEGVPGLGFCIVKKESLENTLGYAHSISLDLHQQWNAMKKTDQWRFTPPTHVILSMDQALKELEDEGGIPARYERYKNNFTLLRDGMRELGFDLLLSPDVQAPIIVTFLMPKDPKFIFEKFYDLLKEKGYAIYPGKLTKQETFRIGCIGRIGEKEIKGALSAIHKTLKEMGINKLS